MSSPKTIKDWMVSYTSRMHHPEMECSLSMYQRWKLLGGNLSCSRQKHYLALVGICHIIVEAKMMSSIATSRKMHSG